MRNFILLSKSPKIKRGFNIGWETLSVILIKIFCFSFFLQILWVQHFWFDKPGKYVRMRFWAQFFWDIHVTHVKDWHNHFHEIYDHQIWTADSKELKHLRLMKLLLLMSSHYYHHVELWLPGKWIWAGKCVRTPWTEKFDETW